jgi:MGT family glycosyltransferase
MRDQMNLIFSSRELQPNASLIDKTYRFVGPSIDPQARDGDFPFDEPPFDEPPFDELREGQVIYISLGTIHHTHTEFYSRCFEAFGNFPAHFILSAGRDTDVATLGEIPANFTVRPSVPQLDVLQRADVFITHGGINSIHEGLYYGVPLIVIPHQFEQLLNALRVEAQGAGLVLKNQIHGRPVSATDLRTALNTILTQSSYRTAALAMQRNLRATGGYRQAADEIQAYIAEGKNLAAH